MDPNLTNPGDGLRSFLTVIFRRRSVLVVVFLLVFGAVAAVTFTMSPVYQASAKLLVQREIDPEKMMLFRMSFPVASQQDDWITSEVETIQSHPVALAVVDSLYLKGCEAPPRLRNEILTRFSRNLGVEAVRESNVIAIRYQDNDPVRAAETVEQVIRQYLRYRSELFDESETYKFFQDQMTIADDKLKELERRQAAFKEQKTVISPDQQREILMGRLTDYERNLTQVRTTRIGKEAKLKVIKEQILQSDGINIPAIEASDTPSREKHIAKLRGDLLDMELRREQLLSKFTPEYEDVVSLEKQIASTRDKVINEIKQVVEMEQSYIAALRAEEDELEAAIEKTSDEIRAFAQKEFQYNQLTRGIDDSREIYSMLLKQREEARISAAKLERGVIVKVINPPVAPLKPVRPQKKLYLALGILLAFFSGFALVFTIDYFDHTIYTPRDLDRMAGVPVLGSIQEIYLDRLHDGRAETRVTRAGVIH